MRNSAMRKAADLAANERQAVEALLGRPLAQDETVAVRAYQTHEAPTGAARDAAYRRLMARIDNTASRVKGLPPEQLDALIDEAVDYAHRHPE